MLYEDDNLLIIAKRIFGDDLVKNAYITNTKSFTKQPDSSDNDVDYFEISHDEIVTEFINGNKVGVWSSEWGNVFKF